ncbi:MAG: hypothetical protein J0H74_08885 [Chitinophagaceae bacterium]|nr:hypothetical protein [Chitinophagaceae bacterium]
MKERLNLTIDAELVESMKAYAASKQMSVSELVESYFRSVTRPMPRTNILDMLDGLERPALDVKADLKVLFYKENGV